MQIIHDAGNLSIYKNVDENVGFLLTNKRGSYCSFSNFPSSRYQGFYYLDEATLKLYKFIENIEVIGHNSINRLRNGFYYFVRGRDSIFESFLMPKTFNSLIYELNTESEINLLLDCKETYDNREFGRYYEISEEDGFVLVKFTKKTDIREDSSNGVEEFVLYLVIKSDKNYFEKIEKWLARDYSYDEERNSPPFRRHIYNYLRLKGSKFIFTISKDKNKGLKECEYIFNNLDEVKNLEKRKFFDMLTNQSIKNIIKNEKLNKEQKIAYINAVYSLDNLIFENNNIGVFAGLPWFFQFWARDTLISLKPLSKINKDLCDRILFNYLKNINKDGRLANLIGEHLSKNLGSADAHGWLFLRCNEIVKKIEKNKVVLNPIKNSVRLIKQSPHANSIRIKWYLKKLNSTISKKENTYQKIFYEIESSLDKSLHGLNKWHSKNNFELNDKLETWMDTNYNGDDRKGVRVEIQALRLNMYKLMYELTQNLKYRIFENILKSKVKLNLWNGANLADGLNDFTVRPNIFIAAYAYPELLTNEEWEICCENALSKLWLDWGGLSTIDKNHHLFTERSTGENPKSYHRGDSWFWINNLAALVLHQINKDKFKKYIQKIIEASTEEILWKGCIGCHAELSSAKEFRSEGCWSQAWSNAMFVELIDEVFQ